MIEEIINAALSSGLFAALFTFLLFYILRDSSNREKKYIETINKLTQHLDAVIEIKKDVVAVKTQVESLSKVVKSKLKDVKKVSKVRENDKELENKLEAKINEQI